MITRRQSILGIGATALIPALSFGQEKKIHRIGTLATGSAASAGYLFAAFAQGLVDLGWVNGKNVLIENRYADGNADLLRPLAEELVQRNVDVIVAGGSPQARAAKAATATIPIVFATSVDPVGLGLVASLARPGGNITGISTLAADLSAKRLQLLKQVFPKVSSVAVVVPRDETGRVQFIEIQRAALVLGIKVFSLEFGHPQDVERWNASLQKWRADSMYVVDDAGTFNFRKLIIDFAAKNRLPAIFATKAHAQAGGLLSYGADYEQQFRRAATFVDKILKGSKPGDLPVEQATNFDLVVNMKTAKVLGIKFPQSILVQATKVIE